ncbi:MAG: DUF2026 family protein [Xanthomonadales bacterium]|nr:DUF2026 family protein [Xanthomonadales bacterium]
MTKSSNTPPKPLLTLPEYDRIYKVIYSILEGRANTPHACMFFAIAGAMILNKHYKIPARPVAGAFLLCVNEVPSIFCIAKRGDGIVTSGRDGFHFWVQTEHHIIDFMAPIFKGSAQGKGYDIAVPRKMFQRLISEEADSIDSLSKPGDYFTLPNPELTEEFIESFFERGPDTDLLCACDGWFKKHPKKLDDIALLDDCGKIYKLVLAAPAISGAW